MSPIRLALPLTILIVACTSAPPVTVGPHVETRDEALTRERVELVRFNKQSKEEFKQTIIVKNESLDTGITITTHDELGQKYGENKLRGFIDKKTGRREYQLYQVFNYQALKWHHYDALTVETVSGPEPLELNDLGDDVDCYSAYTCLFSEYRAALIDEALVRTTAGQYEPGKYILWHFKFSAKDGTEKEFTMPYAKIAAFVEVMDSYSRSAGTK
jgi:hypothetical protein